MEVSESTVSMSTQGSRSHLTIGNKGLTWCQKRTRLERKLLLVSCVMSLVTAGSIVAFVLTCTKMSTITDPSPDLCTNPDCLQSAQHVQEYLDTSIDPCDDFYQFSCGNWDKIHPEVYSNVFEELNEEMFMKLREKLEYPKQEDDPKAIRDAKDVYEVCMNTGVANADGKAHILQWILEFGGWPMIMNTWNKSNFNLEDVLAKATKESCDYFVELSIAPDDKNTSRRAIYVSFFAGSVDPEELLHRENDTDFIENYKALIQNVTQMVSNGTPINEEDIDDLIEFEIMLANISESEVESEFQDFYYNKMTISDLTNITNHRFDWLRYLNGVFMGVKNITEDDSVVVTDPEQLSMFFRLKESVDERVIANYLMWKYWSYYSKHIGDLSSGQIAIFAKTRKGEFSQIPRWDYCLGILNELFYRVTGHVFVKYYLKNETRSLVEDLIAELRISLKEALKGNDWMDEETLQKAQKKADAIIQLVGYPDEIFNETYINEFHEDFEPALVHVVNIRVMLLQLSKSIILSIDKPVDRNRWDFPISTVDAFYNPSVNSVDIPAGIMLPPFFSAGNIKAMNYGALGSVIGHELTHAFDNLRSQYDEYGNLVNWWTNASMKAYQLKAGCLRQQYSNYCLSEDIQTELNLTKKACVNGNQTLGENIADNGGLKIALNAYSSWILRNGNDGSIPGLTQFTPHQLFFISFAQVWCESRTSRGIYYDMSHDEHSPNRYRVLGALSNSEDFASAFQCKKNSTMNPELKCSFW